MALPVNEIELIEGSVVEWERLEFKKGFNPEKVIHTLCAFANDINNWGGGYIILGIDENNGQPVLPPEGLQANQLDRIQKEIVKLSYRIQPNFTPVMQPFVYMEKHVLIIWAPGGDNRPYKAPESLSKGNKVYPYYIRKGSTTVKARGEDERHLLELSAKVPFDDRVNNLAEVDDLDESIIKEFLKTVKSGLYEEIDGVDFVGLCERMNIVRGPQEYKKPINAGLLLFNGSPEKLFRGAVIEIVIYHDEVGDKLTEKTFKGPLHVQLKNALNYIEQNIIAEEVRKVEGQAESERFFNYPYAAIEEALANAVYHRSYENQNTIEVSVRPDCIEILSFPGPLPPIDNDVLKEPRIVARDYRNRRIGDFLKELKLTEGRSTGIPKIRKAMEGNGSPEPVFKTDKDRAYFLTILPIHKGTKPAPSEDIRQKQDMALSWHQVGTKLGPSWDQAEKVLNLCKKPQKINDLMQKFDWHDRTKFRNKYINPFIEEGLIEMTLPDKPTSPDQEYVITEKGKKLLKQ